MHDMDRPAGSGWHDTVLAVVKLRGLKQVSGGPAHGPN
jgi:hypothetical protein